MAFEPRFEITADTAKALMRIEACKAAMENLPVTARLLASLRHSARLKSTHYSTQIEGNRLTAAEVEAVVGEKYAQTPGRERDEIEVRNYYRALGYVESLAENWERLSERNIRILHGLVMKGQGKPTPYRDGQNVIRDSETNAIVYLPPEAKDVPERISELVEWLNVSIEHGLYPSPIVAAVCHYQFATIHPYFDGNGRTARLLTTLILHRSGYGLRGIYSLDEYYAKNLEAYYAALTVGTHNYYEGRAEAEISSFVSYFCEGMAGAFEKVRAQAEQLQSASPRDQAKELRELRPQQRQVISIFVDNQTVTAAQISSALELSPRQGRELCARWLKEGFLVVENPSKRARSYRLAERWEAFVLEK